MRKKKPVRIDTLMREVDDIMRELGYPQLSIPKQRDENDEYIIQEK